MSSRSTLHLINSAVSCKTIGSTVLDIGLPASCNSLATCSSNIDSPIQLSTLRYMYDYDAAGKEAALEKLAQGKSVFLWRKLFQTIGMDEPVKKVDLTDLVVLAKRTGMKLPKLSNFFSDDKYDSYWI